MGWRRGGGRSGSGCHIYKGYVLVIAEKPKAAARIAAALGSARKCKHRSGAPYWVARFGNELYVIGSAVGHIFGLDTDKRGFPVFEYTWRPLWQIDRGASYTKPFYEALRDLSRGARLFVNACDYDIEGSVIGYLVIRFFGDPGRARRAKFSSLTTGELRRAFKRLTPLDLEMVEAGLARHELDWIWGVNVSRALMDSLRLVTGRRVILSAGRVQSPTLIEAVKRDIDNRLHVPLPMYHVDIYISVGGSRKKLRIASFEKRAEAQRAADRLRDGVARVVARDSRKRVLPRPYPFNLGDLQAEAARVFGYSPYYTQKLAEDLYLEGLISYPRTNSQRLPGDLDVNGIVESLARWNPLRKAVAQLLKLTGGILRPRNGPKDDPAHPAIHPTGEVPRGGLDKPHERIYMLIVHRFLATLSRDAVVEYVKFTLDVGGVARRELEYRRVVEPGWLLFYGAYTGLSKEEPVPDLEPGDALRYRVRVTRELSSPPELYTKASLVDWMERVGIGTEATRARIVEILFSRGYLFEEGRKVRASDLGIAVAKVLELFFSELTSVELTRAFEKLLEDIRSGKKRREEVVDEAKRIIRDKLAKFKESHMQRAGTLLAEALGFARKDRGCAICGRPAGEDGFCELHGEAIRRIERSFHEWAAREGLDGGEEAAYRRYLAELAKSRKAGVAVREAAAFLASKRGGYEA